MAGVGTLIGSISLGKPGAPHMKAKERATEAPTTTTTTRTTTTHMPWYHAVSAGRSDGPMLPLVCLFFVCLCGLTALIIAAILDPCQRDKRKKVTRGLNSVDPG